MTRPALAYTNPEPIQAVLPHAEADKTPQQPFFKRALNVRVGGNVDDKVVLLGHAAFCEVFVDGLSGTCLASGQTIRSLCELGNRRFWNARARLVKVGALVPKRRQAGRTAVVRVMATPDLIRLAERKPTPPPSAPADTSKHRDKATLAAFFEAHRNQHGDSSVVPPGGNSRSPTGGETKTPSKPESASRPSRERTRAAEVRTTDPAQPARLRSEAQSAGFARFADGYYCEHEQPPDHRERRVMCRGCNRTRPARHVAQQHCDKCEHSTEDERRIVRAKVHATVEANRTGLVTGGGVSPEKRSAIERMRQRQEERRARQSRLLDADGDYLNPDAEPLTGGTVDRCQHLRRPVDGPELRRLRQ